MRHRVHRVVRILVHRRRRRRYHSRAHIVQLPVLVPNPNRNRRVLAARSAEHADYLRQPVSRVLVWQDVHRYHNRAVFQLHHAALEWWAAHASVLLPAVRVANRARHAHAALPFHRLPVHDDRVRHHRVGVEVRLFHGRHAAHHVSGCHRILRRFPAHSHAARTRVRERPHHEHGGVGHKAAGAHRHSEAPRTVAHQRHEIARGIVSGHSLPAERTCDAHKGVPGHLRATHRVLLAVVGDFRGLRARPGKPGNGSHNGVHHGYLVPGVHLPHRVVRAAAGRHRSVGSELHHVLQLRVPKRVDRGLVYVHLARVHVLPAHRAGHDSHAHGEQRELETCPLDSHGRRAHGVHRPHRGEESPQEEGRQG